VQFESGPLAPQLRDRGRRDRRDAGREAGQAHAPDASVVVLCERNLGALELQQTIAGAATAFSGGELDDDLTLVVAALI